MQIYQPQASSLLARTFSSPKPSLSSPQQPLSKPLHTAHHYHPLRDSPYISPSLYKNRLHSCMLTEPTLQRKAAMFLYPHSHCIAPLIAKGCSVPSTHTHVNSHPTLTLTTLSHWEVNMPLSTSSENTEQPSPPKLCQNASQPSHFCRSRCRCWN